MIKEQNQSIPFHTLITNRAGVVRSIRQVENSTTLISEEEYLNKIIWEVFDYWEEYTESIIFSIKDHKHFILLYSEYKVKAEIQRAYIVIEDQQLFQLKQKVKELDKATLELDAIIENSYDGIYITDKDGITLKTNSAIERITGIPKHYYIGKDIRDLMKRGILQESVSIRVLEEKKTVTVVQKNFNGKETLLTGSPIFDHNGNIDKIVTNIRDLSELNELNQELKKAQQLNQQYKEELDKLKASTQKDASVIIKSKKMLEVYDMVCRIANFDTTILILGETGVGKDVLVRHIHQVSNRYNKGQFIKVNCGAIPKDLMESELFGYEAGAFSGANRNGKQGMFELAHNGILFLDEVGDLPFDLQVKLLRVIQEKEIMRVGGTTSKKINVQLIAATNKDLKEMVLDGKFREDLYYRLNVLPVTIPPLRERRDDILPLAHYFLEQYNQKYSFDKVLDRTLQDYFYEYDWPGNVRELSNVMERLILTAPNSLLSICDLPDEYRKEDSHIEHTIQKEITLKEAVEETERNILQLAYTKYRTTYEIAKHLKTSQATVVRKLQKYNISE